MMKNFIGILFIGCLFLLGTTNCGEGAEPENYEKIPWVKMDEVENLVKNKPKKILVDVYTPWCGPCKMMDRNTFTNPDIINQVGKNFYAVKFNAEDPNPIRFMGKDYLNINYDPNRRGRNFPHDLSKFFAVRGYPTLVIMDTNMKIIDKIVGYKTPDQLQVALEKYTKTEDG